MPRRKIHEAGGCQQRASGSWRCTIRLGGQRLLATFPIDPDDPQMLPKAASDWLDAQRRRKANGEAPDLPASEPHEFPAPGSPDGFGGEYPLWTLVPLPPSRATVGSLITAKVAAAKARRDVLMRSGTASRGELSGLAMTINLGGWLDAVADTPEAKAVLSRQPRFVTVQQQLALLRLRAATRLDATKRLVQRPVAAQTVRLTVYELHAAAPALPALPANWQKQVATTKAATNYEVLTMAQLAHLEGIAALLMHQQDASVSEHLAKYGPTAKRSEGIAVRRNAAAAAAVVALLATGLREGELLGLHWGEVDLGAKTLAVKQQRRQVAGKWVASETKTKAGHRTVALTDLAVDAFNMLAVIVGGSPVASDLVMALPVRRRVQKVGVTPNEPHPVGLSALRGALQRTVAAAGLSEHQTLHDLRKHWATKLAWNGVPMHLVQQQGGWDDVNTLRKIYVRVSSNDPAVLEAVRAGGNRSLA